VYELGQRRPLEQPDAGGQRSAPQAHDVTARVQRSAALLEHTAGECGRQTTLPHLAFREEAHPGAEPLRRFRGAAQAWLMLRMQAGEDVPIGGVVAVDAVLPDHLFGVLHGGVREAHQARSAFAPEEPQQGGDVLPDGRRQVAGVAAAGAGAGEVLLQNRHVCALGP
jgi:hypothetical protein